MAGFKGHRPSGQTSWPWILVAGPEKTGKSYEVAKLSGSDLIGETFWIEVGETTAEEYGGVPGARYILAEHDGTFNDICRRVREAVAEPPRDGKPNMIVIDSASLIWEMLSAEVQELANRRKKADIDAESKITPDLWNLAKDRWKKLVRILRAHKGLVVFVARLEVVAVMDANGSPTKDKTRKVQAHKSLPYDVGVIVQVPEYRRFQITGVRSLVFNMPPGETFDAPADFTLDGLLRKMGLAELGVAEPPRYVEPAPSARDAMAEVVGAADDRPARRERGRSNDEWTTPPAAPATPRPPDLGDVLRDVRGASTPEAQYRALSQILDRKIPVGDRLSAEDVERALAVLSEEARQDRKLDEQDAAKAVRAGQAEAKPQGSTGAQLTLLNTLLSNRGITDRPARLTFLSGFVNHPLTSSKDLTKAEASSIINQLSAGDPAAVPAPELPAHPRPLLTNERLANNIRKASNSEELADASEEVWKARERKEISEAQASGLIDLSMARENELAQPVGASA